MEENKIQDERILSEKREVQSKGYEWIIYILTITIIVQQFFMRAPFSQFAIRLTMISINNKKQQAIDKELNMDDDIIE
ncbi:MAG: DUF6773 family protein [Anaerovoracaceae bacterium]